MHFREYLSILRRRWLLLSLCALLGLGLAAALSFTATPIYNARASVYFSLPFGNSASDLSQGSNYTQSQMLSYATLATMPAVLEPVIQDLQLGVTPGQLASSVTAIAQTDTVILEIQASDPSPETASAIANAVAAELGESVKNLAPKNAEGNPAVTTQTVAAAPVPTVPASPSTRRNLAAGLIAGLFIGGLIAVLREVLDTTIRSAQGLRAVGDIPVLGVIGNDPATKRSPLVLDSNRTRSARAEAFRQLRTNLQFVDLERPVQVLVVTSSLPEEGKSTTAANVALAFADSGQRVLLLEADLRRPRVAEYLGLEGAVGLTNVLMGQVSLDEVLQTWGESGLTVLPSGTLPPNPSELLGSVWMSELISTLRERFNLIIIDTPPLLPVTDAAVASSLADGAVLVVRYGKTTRHQVGVALRSLKAVDARVLGSVLTMAPTKGTETYYGHNSAPALELGKVRPPSADVGASPSDETAISRHGVGLRRPADGVAGGPPGGSEREHGAVNRASRNSALGVGRRAQETAPKLSSEGHGQAE